jgi:hypothetical protein
LVGVPVVRQLKPPPPPNPAVFLYGTYPKI